MARLRPTSVGPSPPSERQDEDGKCDGQRRHRRISEFGYRNRHGAVVRREADHKPAEMVSPDASGSVKKQALTPTSSRIVVPVVPLIVLRPLTAPAEQPEGVIPGFVSRR